MRCAVFNCSNTNNNRASLQKFYTFPRDKQLLEKWINFCRRNDYFNYKTSRICSAHFRPEDILRNMQYEMGFCTQNGCKLKPGTVPTLETNNRKRMRLKRGPGPEPVAISRISFVTSSISCVTVKAEPPEFIGDLDEPVAFIISAIKAEKGEENEISEIEIKSEAITEQNVADLDPIEFVNSVNQPSPPVNQVDPIEFVNQPSPPDIKVDPFECVNSVNQPSPSAKQVGHFECVNSVNQPSPPANQQLKDQMKALREELAELRYNKIGLQRRAKKHTSDIYALKRRLVKAVYERDNMQAKLLQIFSTEQVNSLKNGIETQAWTDADIEQSNLLYTASSKAYKMLREKSFPLPAVETLNNWKKKNTDTSITTEITLDAAKSKSS